MPPSQLIFQVTPLNGRQWVAVLQISLPVILLDEALKYLSRKHVDGEWRPQTTPYLLASSPPPCLPLPPVCSGCRQGLALQGPGHWAHWAADGSTAQGWATSLSSLAASPAQPGLLCPPLGLPL